MSTEYDILGEIASRICYDSLGLDADGKRRGRSSEKLHDHILEVKNHSVYEHINYTLIFEDLAISSTVRAMLNRKGVWIDIDDATDNIEVSVNARTVLEWDRYLTPTNSVIDAPLIQQAFLRYGHQLAPQVIRYDGPFLYDQHVFLKKAADLTADQAWISLYLYGSRGFTHEQVRHRFAMSQRSTRYVDESESDYIIHPLIQKYLNYPDNSSEAKEFMQQMINNSMNADRDAYRYLVHHLQEFILGPNHPLGTMDKLTARKQARGAARGFLGNALASEMIFSAPASGWRWILNQRASKQADAEIREIYTPALAALKSSQYSHFFDDYEMIDSPDGMGKILA